MILPTFPSLHHPSAVDAVVIFILPRFTTPRIQSMANIEVLIFRKEVQRVSSCLSVDGSHAEEQGDVVPSVRHSIRPTSLPPLPPPPSSFGLFIHSPTPPLSPFLRGQLKAKLAKLRRELITPSGGGGGAKGEGPYWPRPAHGSVHSSLIYFGFTA